MRHVMKQFRQWKDAFIKAMRLMGNVSKAASFAGVSRQTPYQEYDRDPAFAKAWRDAEEAACDRLEAEAWRRAHDGIDKPVFHQGEQCGVIREYSDGLMTLLLKALRPKKFRDNANVTLGNADGSNLELTSHQQTLNLLQTNPAAVEHMLALTDLLYPTEEEKLKMANVPVQSSPKPTSEPTDTNAAASDTAKSSDVQPTAATAAQADSTAPDCNGSPVEPPVKRKYTKRAKTATKQKKPRQKASQTQAPAIPEDLDIPEEPETIKDVPKATIIPNEPIPETTPQASTPEPTPIKPVALSPFLKSMLNRE